MTLYNTLKEYRLDNSLPWFDKPFDLNLICLRSDELVGEWDSLMVIACLDDSGREIVQRVRVTDDAWVGEWSDPTNRDGCIFVLDGHYPKGFVLGEHKGRVALRQNAPFRYVRWPAGGSVPSIADLEARAAAGHEFTNVCGTHWHNRYDDRAPPRPMKDDSEGCFVSLWRHQHAAGMELAAIQKRRHGSGVVSPTFVKKKLVLP